MTVYERKVANVPILVPMCEVMHTLHVSRREAKLLCQIYGRKACNVWCMERIKLNEFEERIKHGGDCSEWLPTVKEKLNADNYDW